MRINIAQMVGLVVVPALLVGCGSEKQAQEEKQAQAESIAALEKLGGSFLGDGKNLDLDLMSTAISDAGLVHLEGLTGL